MPVSHGVECQVCHEETFQVFEREAHLSKATVVTVRCCKFCRNRIDLENEDEQLQVSLAAMTKADRRRVLQERSLEWAAQLNGKRVVVHYNVHHSHSETMHRCQVTGRAERAGATPGGWGVVKVFLDHTEYHRISYERDYYIENREQKYYERPVVDGYRWGLYLVKEWNGKPDIERPWRFYVSWGQRRDMLVEVRE